MAKKKATKKAKPAKSAKTGNKGAKTKKVDKKPAKSAKSAKPSKSKNLVKKTSTVTKKANPAAAAKPAKKAAAQKPAATKTNEKAAKTVKKTSTKQVAKAAAPAKAEPVKTLKKETVPAKKDTAKAKSKVTSIDSSKETKSGKANQKAVEQSRVLVQPKLIETNETQLHARVEGEELFDKSELDMFRKMLNEEKSKILNKAKTAMASGNIYIDKDEMYDEVDQASAMIEQNLTFRLLDRDRRLLTEIEHALAKLESGDFGYCEGTGEPIPKRRLELRPWTRHSVKYQEKLERMRKTGRGVGDEDEM